LDQALKETVKKLCLDEGRSALIPALQAVQGELGYLSKESMQYISGVLEVPVSEIYGVATFYNQFRLMPKGKHIIKVCRGTACHVKGSGQLLSLLETELAIKVGETTRDKIFSLEAVACLGACSIAPVIMVDNKFYGNLSSEDVSHILSRYR
jgi:NADH-quinone oxidoreductase E subunit